MQFTSPISAVPATSPEAIQAVESKAGRQQIRHDLIARIRAEIQLGVYDTDERFNIAVLRALEDLASI